MLYYNRKKIVKEVFFSMNILSHILNFETKNLLINQLILKIKNFITDFIESILINFSHNRYIYNFLNFQKSFNHMIVELIIKFIEFLDNEYKNSNIRKKIIILTNQMYKELFIQFMAKLHLIEHYIKIKLMVLIIFILINY